MQQTGKWAAFSKRGLLGVSWSPWMCFGCFLAVPPTANLLWPSAKTILNENEKAHLCPVGIDERKRSMCWEVKRGNFAMSKYQVMWWSRKISKDRREWVWWSQKDRREIIELNGNKKECKRWSLSRFLEWRRPKMREKDQSVESEKSKRTTPGIRTWSPTVLLARPDSA